MEQRLKHHRVLLFSHTPLFAEAITKLLQHEEIEVVASVFNQADAQPYLAEQSVNSVVVELDDLDASQRESVAQLWSHEHLQSIVFLTRQNNRMIVHHCETIENVTPDQLFQALLK